MHPAALEYIAQHAPPDAKRVLDAGGRDINGSPRILFSDDTEYVVVDTVKHPSVDHVADILDLRKTGKAKLALGTFDVIIYAEVAEHTPEWEAHLAHLYQMLAPGGRLVVTAADTGRTPHSSLHGGPLEPDEYYANLSREELAACLQAIGPDSYEIDQVRNDIRVTLYRDAD